MQWQLNEQAICLDIDTENHLGSITTMIDNINQQTINIKDESIK